MISEDFRDVAPVYVDFTTMTKKMSILLYSLKKSIFFLRLEFLMLYDDITAL